MSRKLHRRRGGQPGNQNARKHGFYSRAITPEIEISLRSARAAEGLDDEIALARAKIAATVKHDPANSDVLLRALNVLARLVRVESRLTTRVANSPVSGAFRFPKSP